MTEQNGHNLKEINFFSRPGTRPLLTIGTPYYDTFTYEYVMSLFSALSKAKLNGIAIQLFLVKATCIQTSRNLIFNNAQGEYLLFIDTDMEFTAQDIETLLEMKKDIVGGLYFQRVHIENATAAMRNGEVYKCLTRPEIPPEPFQVDVTGGGFMMIKRRVIENYPVAKFQAGPFDYIPAPRVNASGRQTWGEDWSFCRRMKEIGYEVWVNPKVTPGHVGNVVIRPGDIRIAGGAVINPETNQSEKRNLQGVLGQSDIAVNEPNAKVLHLPQKPKNGELLRVRKNDRETIIFSLEVVEGETYLNAHTFIELDGKLLPTDKTSSTPLTCWREARAQMDRGETEYQQLRQAIDQVEKELLLKGLIPPFTDLPLGAHKNG